MPHATARATRLTIETNLGALVVKLHAADGETPLTAAAVAGLAKGKVYDHLTWHRVVPDFVIQGGDPRGDGDGGPGFVLPDEHTPFFFKRGTFGIATSGPDTGGSQFFLCHSAQPHLDGRYTIAGELESGWDVLDAIMVGDEIKTVTAE
ncbi:MAG: peptidylprolyl isomerase [Deltaproteobacteria bacterium]|nr:peptidylprolyl isomerase [Deltaproteobacteria bacterium]